MKTKKNSHWVTGLLGLALLLLPLAGHANADTTAPIVSQTIVKGSVDQTLSTLRKIVADNGMMVMGELHQGKVLKMTGLTVKSESVFLGNPNVGKKLFAIEPGAGVALPIRVNIFENSDSETVVAYVPPSKLLAGFNNPKLEKAAGMLDGKLAKLVGMLGQ